MTKKRKAPEVTRRPPPPPQLPHSDDSSDEEEEEEEEENVEKPSGGTDDQKKAQNPESSDTGSESEADEAKGKAVETHQPQKSAKGANPQPQKSAKVESSSGKPLIQRVWGEEDEVTVLQGMIDYCKKERLDPTANVQSFHEFMEGKLRFDAAPEQLRTKMRNSRRKFRNNEKRGKVWKGKGAEVEVYELAKVLWGSDDGLITNMFTPKSRPGRPPPPPHTSGLSAAVSRFLKTQGADGAFLMGGLEHVGGPERGELEQKWQKLQVEQLQVLSKEALLIHQQIEQTLKVNKKAR